MLYCFTRGGLNGYEQPISNVNVRPRGVLEMTCQCVFVSFETKIVPSGKSHCSRLRRRSVGDDDIPVHTNDAFNRLCCHDTLYAH